MEYTAALKGKRFGFRQNPQLVSTLQKLFMTEYFSAFIPLGDAGVNRIRPLPNPLEPKIWARRPPIE